MRYISLTFLMLFSITVHAHFVTDTTGADLKEESVQLALPKPANWTELILSNNPQQFSRQLFPSDEMPHAASKTIMVVTVKNASMGTTGELIKDIKSKASSQSRWTTFQQSDKTGNQWALFKVESPEPDSRLYYAVQGKSSFHIVSVIVKQKVLTAEFVQTWSRILKQTRLITE